MFDDRASQSPTANALGSSALSGNGIGVHFRCKTNEIAKGGYKEFALR
jgi:hypothetical protein